AHDTRLASARTKVGAIAIVDFTCEHVARARRRMAHVPALAVELKRVAVDARRRVTSVFGSIGRHALPPASDVARLLSAGTRIRFLPAAVQKTTEDRERNRHRAMTIRRPLRP